MRRLTLLVLLASAAFTTPLIAQDCNSNGIDDAIDIANGTSVDLLGNGVPDECELELLLDEDFGAAKPSLWTLHAHAQLSGGAVKLNDGVNSSGTLIHQLPLQLGASELRVRALWRATPTADGMTLMLRSSTAAPLPAGLTEESLWIHFDHYDNWDQSSEPNGNHFSLEHAVQPHEVVAVTTPPFTIEDGVWRWFELRVRGNVVDFWIEELDGTVHEIFQSVTISGFEPGPRYVFINGWNGAGGGGSSHWIDDLTILASPGIAAPDCDGDTIPDSIVIAAGLDGDCDGDGVPDGCDPCSLWVDPGSLSLNSGGTATFTLDAGPTPVFNAYLLLGSATGTEPGLAVDDYVLPLVYDVYTASTLSQPNQGPFGSTFGILSGGQGSATLTVPAGTDASLAGLVLHHAYVVIDLTPGIDPEVVFVSNAASLTLVP